MIFNFFVSLFKKQIKNSKLPIIDSLLLKNLKLLCKNNNFSFYQELTLYHHNQSIDIPLLILDPNRGIYIFEYKEWSFKDLNINELKKSSDNESATDTLAYDKINKFITTKFNEIIHTDGVKIFNFLLTQNLSYEDYKHLEKKKQELLPHQRIIFNDSNEEDILFKLTQVAKEDPLIAPREFILANLLTQYIIYENNNNIHLATDEQINFIENEKYNIEFIYGHTHSGKTTSLLLKAILIKLKYSDLNVTIIEPTTLSCDKLKVKLLEIVEYTIVDIDITSISIITPSEFKLLNKIDPYILCDDSNLLENNFINYLYSKAKKSKLSLINPKNTNDNKNIFKFTHKFHEAKVNYEFINSNPIASAMRIISEYNSTKNNLSILCISSHTNKVNLDEDLKFFIKDKAVLLDSSKGLIDQENSHIMLSDYENINTQKADIVILLDIDKINEDTLAYAISLANQKVYIIYIEECEKIINLKKIFKG